jgi:YrbI family 3-deoxy-D-manno-octulosonate 8-phosphate phosphatase
MTPIDLQPFVLWPDVVLKQNTTISFFHFFMCDNILFQLSIKEERLAEVQNRLGVLLERSRLAEERAASSELRLQCIQEKIDAKIKDIRMLILDVDGVLTDGGMYVSEKGDQMKRYHTHDGLALLDLSKSGKMQLGIISSGFTEHMVQDRAKLLGISHVYVGQDSKLSVLVSWCSELGLKMNEIAFIGDDRNDLKVMEAVGLAVCPASAVPAVKSISDIILSKKGGDACVREFIDHYLS